MIYLITGRKGAGKTTLTKGIAEYFGIKKRTDITKNKSGEITGAPTTLSYYVLATPDDELNDNNVLDKLDEDRRVKTQKKIDLFCSLFLLKKQKHPKIS
jgi:ATPase subunit of ABC transporter with duplicated ATPase domains